MRTRVFQGLKNGNVGSGAARFLCASDAGHLLGTLWTIQQCDNRKSFDVPRTEM